MIRAALLFLFTAADTFSLLLFVASVVDHNKTGVIVNATMAAINTGSLVLLRASGGQQ